MKTTVKQTKSNRILFYLSLAALGITLCGCGKNKNSSLTTQGMDAVATLDYNTAIDLFSQAAEAGENTQLLKRGEGIAYMGLSKYDEAVDSFEESLSNASWRIGPLERDTNYYLAAAFEKMDDHQAAIEVYDAIIGMWPKEKQAHTLRGFVYLKSGDINSANEDFSTVLSLYPTDYDNLVEIYKALDSSGFSQAGEEYLRTTLNEHESDMTGFDKGRIYYYLGDYDSARNHLEGVRDTGSAAILYLGLAYEALGDYNYATSVYQSFISSKKGDALIYNQLGVCEMQMGNYDQAYDHFSEGLELEDSSCRQSLLFNQISASEHMGNFDKAKKLMADYLKLYPDDEAAKREQIFLSTR